MNTTPNDAAKSAINSRTKAAHPEAQGLITGANSLEALFLASAQAVALDNPREGAALALKGMMYADLKAGITQITQMVAAAQAAEARARAERQTAAAAVAAAEQAREEEMHRQQLRQATAQAEREELKTERVRSGGSEY